MELHDEIRLVVEVAREAGRVALGYLGQVGAERKREGTATEEVVTEADRACQRLIVERLRAAFPGDGLVGEEGADGKPIMCDVREPGGRVWVIDPIDGTANFVTGMPWFAVCIARLERGMPVLGVVYDVVRGEAYFGARGEGAWLEGRDGPAARTRLQVDARPLVKGSLIMVSDDLAAGTGEVPAYVARWLSEGRRRVRILGSAALEVMQVAAGFAHGAVTLNGKLWDVAAPAAILLESGGLVTSPEGEAIFPFDVRGYAGAPVPFLAAAAGVQGELVGEVRAG